MAVTRMAEELHRCASSRRAMEQLRTAQICNGEAPKCCDLQGRSFDLLWEQMRSATERLCSAMEKNGYATTGDGGAKKGVGIAGICPALRGISGQRTCIGAEKRGAKKQVHREARALIPYAKALKGDVLHRHRGAVTRRAKEMGSMDKRGVRQTRGEALRNRLAKLSRGTAETSRWLRCTEKDMRAEA